MAVYSVDKLMKETRRLAAQYHQTTGQILPVTQELARYDVKRLLNLTDPKEPQAGVDAIGAWEYGEKVQIKGRVIFNEEKSRQRIGQINREGAWDCVALILFDHNYEPDSIYLVKREEIEEDARKAQANPNKRGLLSVAKFKAIGRLLWTNERGVELNEIWQNPADER